MSYKHLTPVCRGRIQALHEQGLSNSAIAGRMGRHRTSIGRELRRNGMTGSYDALKAQRRYEERRKECRPRIKLEYQPLRDFVFQQLPAGWTPEVIAGILPRKFPENPQMRISHEALYQGLYGDERLHCLIAHLPQARPKRRKRGQGKSRRGPAIPNRVGIEHRPIAVDDRDTHGHWEGDTIVGSHQRGYFVTLVERHSLLTIASKVDTKHASEVAQAITEAFMEMPASWLKTLTLDNGTEFARHEDIAAKLPLSIYFAAPYASYQRGTNENTNGLLRRYFPKRTNLSTVSHKDLNQAVQDLNNRPRKKLGYRTPNEVFQKLLADKRDALRA
jgi:transposase, IS30 family